MLPIKRTQGRDLVVTLCLFALFGLLGWSLLSSYVQAQGRPELKAASAALDGGNTNRAVTEFDRLIKQKPDGPERYLAVYQICVVKENWALAKEYAQRGVQECKYAPNEQRAELYMALAMAQAEIEAPPRLEAIEAADHARQLAPKDPRALNCIGYLLADNDMALDRAQVFLTQALRLANALNDRPENRLLRAEIEDSYGWLLYKQGKFAAAVDMLNEAISDIPEGLDLGTNLKVWHYHLGAAYRKAGRFEQARTALQAALQYDPDYREAQAALGGLPPPVQNTGYSSPMETESEGRSNASRLHGRPVPDTSARARPQ